MATLSDEATRAVESYRLSVLFCVAFWLLRNGPENARAAEAIGIEIEKLPLVPVPDVGALYANASGAKPAKFG